MSDDPVAVEIGDVHMRAVKVTASDLRVGDYVSDTNGRLHRIVSVRRRRDRLTTQRDDQARGTVVPDRDVWHKDDMVTVVR